METQRTGHVCTVAASDRDDWASLARPWRELERDAMPAFFVTHAWLDAYWRTDASLRLTFNDTLWLGATIENATDTTYQEWPLINPAPGRLYALELGGQW